MHSDGHFYTLPITELVHIQCNFFGTVFDYLTIWINWKPIVLPFCTIPLFMPSGYLNICLFKVGCHSQHIRIIEHHLYVPINLWVSIILKISMHSWRYQSCLLRPQAHLRSALIWQIHVLYFCHGTDSSCREEEMVFLRLVDSDGNLPSPLRKYSVPSIERTPIQWIIP